MNKRKSIQKILLGAIAVCFVFTALWMVFAVRSYYSSLNAVEALNQDNDRLAKLQKDVELAKLSIESYKKEQEEFKGLLFEERDVPAFLDGISNSAEKSSVYVLEMKSQQFSEVTVPKTMQNSNKNSKRARVYDGFEEPIIKDPKEQINEVLTLAAMPIRIKIQGSFESIVNFLYSIENYRQLLTVSNVEISSGNQYPQLTCEFMFRIYSLKRLSDVKL